SVGGEPVAAIGEGLLVLLGVTHDDTLELADRMADKLRALRVFADAEGRMNEPLGDRAALVVSQFTLYADARRGNRPSYVAAEPPGAAQHLGEIGEPGDVVWFPDRTYAGRTFVPATVRTSQGLELFGYVSYVVGDEPGNYHSAADITEETAETHPEWKIDLCD